MNGRRPCPDLGALARVLSEAVADDDEAGVAAHLEDCAGCRRRLEALAGDTPSPDAIRGAARPGGPPEESLRRAIAALKAAAPATTAPPLPAAGGPPALDFLAPPGRAECLGVLGRYDVLEVIGRGGMGIVLKAFDPALRRFVAVKVLAPHLATSPAARQLFAREGRAAAAIRHEHVVAVHGVDEANGLPYLVMEYVEGTSLQERIDCGGPLPLEEILRVGMQAASGLAAAHAQGLVHRDVKPANILLEDGEGRVKITDFGLARAVDDASLTQSGLLAGTPQYMAPEQARGEPVDHRADLFSLGSVLYACCAGRPPFRGPTAMAVLRRVCDEAPRPLREVAPDVPAWLADLIAVLHAKDPARRCQSAGEVSDLLCGYLAYLEQPELVRPPAGPSRWQVWRAGGRVGPRGVALAVAAALLALGLAASGARWLTARLTADRPGASAALRVGPRASMTVLSGPVLSVAWAPGSEVLAAGADDRTVYLLDAAGGGPRGRLEGHHHRVWAVAYSPDGKALASAAGDGFEPGGGGELWLWDATTGRHQALAGHDGPVYSVAFSPDSRTLASGGLDGTVRLWDVASGKQRHVLRLHRATVRSVAFSPDGTVLAAGSFDGTVGLWDAGTGRRLRVLKSPGCFINAVAFSPDGATLASADDPLPPAGKGDEPRAWAPGVVRLWDVASGRPRAVLEGHRGRVLCVAFAPGGRSLVSGGGLTGSFGEVIFWDPEARKQRLTLHGHSRPVESVAFSPDGRVLASAGGLGGQPGEVKLWDVNPPPARASAPGGPAPAWPYPPPRAPAATPVPAAPPAGAVARPPGQPPPGPRPAAPPAREEAPRAVLMQELRVQ